MNLPTERVVIMPCPCFRCSMYNISWGVFTQGCGWNKDEAQFIADAINEKITYQRVLNSLQRVTELLEKGVKDGSKVQDG